MASDVRFEFNRRDTTGGRCNEKCTQLHEHELVQNSRYNSTPYVTLSSSLHKVVFWTVLLRSKGRLV